jgi:hypothetical protein
MFAQGIARWGRGDVLGIFAMGVHGEEGRARIRRLRACSSCSPFVAMLLQWCLDNLCWSKVELSFLSMSLQQA